MLKAIILTYANIEQSEKSLLQSTNIFKLALNQHAEELYPDYRIITDYFLEKMCKNFSQKIISVRDRLNCYSDKVEYFDGKFKGATILSAIDYLLSKDYEEILIIGDNKVHDPAFQNLINTEIDKLDTKTKIYQYSDGNFHLPVKTIEEFCNK